MFAITDNKGFQITFANGYKVSVQFGAYNYCEGYNNGFDYLRQRAKDIEKSDYVKSPDAETALISPSGKFVEYDGGDVQGYRTPAEVLKLLNYAESLPKPEESICT